MGKTKDKEKKKKKDKDKERSKKDKDLSKDKSRHKSDRRPSTDEEGDSKHHTRHSSPSRSKKDKRDDLKRKHSPELKESRSKRSNVETGKDKQVEVTVESKGSSDASLSIEETNKLRLQLGLKPLDLGGEGGKKEASTTGEGGQDNVDEEETESKKKDAQHMPPKNIGEEAAAEKMREKLKVMRESREMAKKLSKVKGLGEAEEGEEVDTVDWVTRMREKDREKEMAKKRAKLLEEMDDEFGVSDLMRDEYPNRPSATQPPGYSADSLSGLKIEHKDDHFREGKDMILTLKDAPVLDEESGDVLVNVNMLDEEHAARNVQLKKGLPGYKPYEEEFDEYGNPKTRSLLYKYDEEIDGKKKESFVLGQKGTFDVGKLEREREASKRILEQRAIKLELPKPVIASEYYTNEEMVQFKKRKRRKRKDKFKPDELLLLANEEESKDHGSRKRIVPEESVNEVTDMEVDIKPDPVLLDEQDSSTETALARTRRLLKGGKSLSDRKTGASFVATLVAATPVVKHEEDDDKGMIVLNTTAEFCRNIGEEEAVINMEEENVPIKLEGDNEIIEEEEGEMEDDNDAEQRGGWTEVDPSSADPNQAKKSAADVDVLELDVAMSTGVAAALQMASKKGFIDGEGTEKKRDGSTRTIIEGLGVRDWEYERDRGRERDRERDHGREMPFAEKSGYTPDVNIEYVDTLGRLLTPKEAFRHMSHKFHGKTSGKKKNEKRLKRLQEEFLLNQASTVDTPLQTVELFRKRQENSQSPFVVLSGPKQQHALNTTELSKRK